MDDIIITKIINGTLFQDVSVIKAQFIKTALHGYHNFYTAELYLQDMLVMLTSHSFMVSVFADGTSKSYDIFQEIFSSGRGMTEIDILINSFKALIEDFTGDTFDAFTYGIWNGLDDED